MYLTPKVTSMCSNIPTALSGIESLKIILLQCKEHS